MKKQSGAKAKLKIFTIVILAMFMIAVYVLCEIKIERIRNEKKSAHGCRVIWRKFLRFMTMEGL